ncbi:MAG: hypothetical protein JWM64_2422 [Frankiales bacterium]|nr:hypothetical protein [Frankiales bacterium]
MTETSAFPFTPLDEPEGTEDAGNRRVLLMAGGVVAALALAGASYVFLGSSDQVDDTAFTPVTRAAQPATVGKKATAATRKIATPKVPVPFDEALGRNPFKALYVVPAAAPAAAVGVVDPTLPQGTTGTTVAVGTGTGTTTGTGTSTGTSAGSTTTTGSTTTGTAAKPAAAPAAPTAREYALMLQRVYGAGKDLTAEFTIDGRKQVAKIGVRFGPTSEIRLISLQQGPKASQWTAVLQVGDGEPFDAVTGDKVSVR